MNNYNDKDRLIALAGIFQAARLARNIARQGQCNNQAFDASIQSLFIFDPDSAMDVFGGISGIASGLRSIISQLDSPEQRDIEIAQYVIAMIHLSDKLTKKQEGLELLGNDLEKVQQRMQSFELGKQTLQSQLADIYQQHISEIQPPILVRGEPLYLENSANAAKVRCALLTGIRAAILWRQCGGKKRQLLFSRAKIVTQAQKIIQTS